MRINEEISEAEAGSLIGWAREVIGGDISAGREAHGDEGVVYRLDSLKGIHFLKIRKGSDLKKERERLDWLASRLPVPRVVAATVMQDMGALLLTAIPGRNLAVLSKEWPAETVIEGLAEALRKFHALNTEGWPFEMADPSKILVHGDACLPNFLFYEGAFSGYIDLGAARLGNVEIDLAAAVWSLQYNMGPGHGPSFLREYGYFDFTEAMAEKLRMQYEEWQGEQGFL